MSAPLSSPTPPKRILALASAGGHWQQLMLMRPAFEGHDVHYVTTLDGLAEQFDALPASTVRDCHRDSPVAVLICTIQLIGCLRRHRPDVILSTGALPGLIALALGRLIRARTIWVDSVANCEEMSMSGRHARRVADLWLSQWAHVAQESGADYAGRVL